MAAEASPFDRARAYISPGVILEGQETLIYTSMIDTVSKKSVADLTRAIFSSPAMYDVPDKGPAFDPNGVLTVQEIQDDSGRKLHAETLPVDPGAVDCRLLNYMVSVEMIYPEAYRVKYAGEKFLNDVTDTASIALLLADTSTQLFRARKQAFERDLAQMPRVAKYPAR